MAICAELSFKKLIFVGAVGGLKPEFPLGDICTPSCCICGNYANTYLKPSIHDFVPFERVKPQMDYIHKVITQLKMQNLPIKLASVFCTDSIALEYSHLDEIKAFDADLIEMETSSFYLMADLLETPAIALLVVSDNSASGTSLVGRTEEESLRYNKARTEILPQIMQAIFSI